MCVKVPLKFGLSSGDKGGSKRETVMGTVTKYDKGHSSNDGKNKLQKRIIENSFKNTE